MIARLVASKLSEPLGQTVIVDNRSGANGTIGSAIVAHAAPDGYTLLAATLASHVTAMHLMRDLPFDPVKDLTPIMAAAEPVTALVVNAELPVNSVQESSPTPRPIRARSTWHRPATDRRIRFPASCSK